MLEKYRDAYNAIYMGVRFIDNFHTEALPEEAKMKLSNAKYRPGDKVRRYSGAYDSIVKITVCNLGESSGWTVCYWLKNSQYPYFEHELKQ